MMGNLMMRSMREFFYRRLSYVICKTKQGFPPAGYYLSQSTMDVVCSSKMLTNIYNPRRGYNTWT